MPYVEPQAITDIKDRKVRAQLAHLLKERAVLGYTFSYERLHKVLAKKFGSAEIDELIRQCVIAFNDKEEKDAKEKLNEQVMTIYTENGIDKTMRFADPFGTIMDFCLMEGTSSSFDKTKAMQWAVRHGIAAETFSRMYEENTTKKKYVTLTARAVKFGEQEE